MSVAQKTIQNQRSTSPELSNADSTSHQYRSAQQGSTHSNISLDALGIKHNCDKSSVNRSTGDSNVNSRGHDYLRKYEFYIKHFRQKADFRLLELGIGPDWNMGASLKIWLDYFPNEDFHATIADINPNALKFEDARVSIKVGNLESPEFLNSLGKNTFDLVVDDASHIWSHQISAFEQLFSSLNSGGVYIIEDTQTSFGNARKKWGAGCTQDAFEYLTKLSGLVVGDGGYHPLNEELEKCSKLSELANSIESITFIRHSCIICKNGYYK